MDALTDTAAGEVIDLRERFAYPSSISALRRLMGVPEEQIPVIRRCVDAAFSTALSAKETAEHAATLHGVLDGLIEAKRHRPGDDMTSAIIDARDREGDGSALTDAEVRDTLLLMTSAGYETTVNLLDMAITLLLSHPVELAHVRAGRASWECGRRGNPPP